MNKICASVILFTFISVSIALAEPAHQETFFRDCIERKIAKCERQCELATSKGKNLREAGRRARDQLIFLQNNKEGLIREMVRGEVPLNRSKVEYFLIKSYSGNSSGFARVTD